MDAVGSGAVQEKEKAFLDEILQKVNGLFDGELTDDDQLVYVNGVLKGKLLENETLVQQAMSNSKQQFANSPDLGEALLHAIMDAFEAHNAMSAQALGSPSVREGLRISCLGPLNFMKRYEHVLAVDRRGQRSAARGRNACLLFYHSRRAEASHTAAHRLHAVHG
ncbi:hypothetical protein WQE_15311 [Paraburkholderia hospita]|uniref:Uncharacterized protein n=1 Tax=Paraburkholderia hospita TaxID=169430 RepID=A0ABP2PT67_9BURK|nr:hypothetical protein WQE_15311 [Paraburkholderia hospita]